MQITQEELVAIASELALLNKVQEKQIAALVIELKALQAPDVLED